MRGLIGNVLVVMSLRRILKSWKNDKDNGDGQAFERNRKAMESYCADLRRASAEERLDNGPTAGGWKETLALLGMAHICTARLSAMMEEPDVKLAGLLAKELEFLRNATGGVQKSPAGESSRWVREACNSLLCFTVSWHAVALELSGARNEALALVRDLDEAIGSEPASNRSVDHIRKAAFLPKVVMADRDGSLVSFLAEKMVALGRGAVLGKGGLVQSLSKDHSHNMRHGMAEMLKRIEDSKGAAENLAVSMVGGYKASMGSELSTWKDAEAIDAHLNAGGVSGKPKASKASKASI